MIGMSFSFLDISAVRVGKSLGLPLGRGRGGVSGIDGDGDGFLTGPDGRDDIPAPKKLVEGFEAAAAALREGREPPARLEIPDGWFKSERMKREAQAAFPDLHLRWDKKFGGIYVPATGRLKADADVVDHLQDAQLAAHPLKRAAWHPAMVPADSPVAGVMRLWRSNFAESRAIARALGGKKVPEQFDNEEFRQNVEQLRTALATAPRLGRRTYRTSYLWEEMGDSTSVGSELNFSAAAVAVSQTDAQAFAMDELAGAAGEKIMFQFPEDTHGLFFDEAGEMALGRRGARGGETGKPIEGIVTGKFKVARIERQEFKNPLSGKMMSRDVVVLERIESKTAIPFAIKILGRSIGVAGRVSEVDGDGDGFLTGPDGEDNIPAPTVAAAKKVVRSSTVDELIKPTKDIAEARKRGRPWAPLVFDALPEDMKREFTELYDEVVAHFHDKGSRWKKKEDELIKKYGSISNVPDDVMAQHYSLMRQHVYPDSDRDKESKSKDTDLWERMNAWDKKHHSYIKSIFDENRKKEHEAGRGKKFDKDFKVFSELIQDDRNFSFAARMLNGSHIGGAAFTAFSIGYQQLPLDTKNQFEYAEGEAKKLVDNPDKRIVAFVDRDVLLQILDSGEMRNFFQSRRNTFVDDFERLPDRLDRQERKSNYIRGRLRGEQHALGLPMSGFEGRRRPIYAMLYPDGFHVMDDNDYGGVAIVMRHSVESRSTFTGGDSLNFGFLGSSPINAPSALSMIAERHFGMSADSRRRYMAEGGLSNFGYVEAQIMGGVSVSDIAYISVEDESRLSNEVRQRLDKMGIPVIVHSSKEKLVEPDELKAKNEDSAGGYVLFATYGNRKIFVPSRLPNDGDYHGFISVGNKERRRIENIVAYMKFGNWELV